MCHLGLYKSPQETSMAPRGRQRPSKSPAGRPQMSPTGSPRAPKRAQPGRTGTYSVPTRTDPTSGVFQKQFFKTRLSQSVFKNLFFFKTRFQKLFFSKSGFQAAFFQKAFFKKKKKNVFEVHPGFGFCTSPQTYVCIDILPTRRTHFT